MYVFSISHKRNIGELDRGVRALLALANIALIFAPYIYGFTQFLLIVTAVLLSYSAYSGHCFVYHLLGISSCIDHQCDDIDKENHA